MATQIEIKFLAQPLPGDAFGYVINVDGVPLVYTPGSLTSVSKSYQNFDGAPNVIGIKETLPLTVTATRNNLSTFNAHAGVSYTVVGNSVFVTVAVPGIITVTNITDTASRVLVQVAGAEPVLPFDAYQMEISIYDTYVNERVLIDELTQMQSPKISWDSGDDLYSAFMPSKLTFNMLVPDALDAKFLHLLTGDERRYLVQLRAVSEENMLTLLWQGFLLPDQYAEPYKNGAFFVEFTAVDMLQTLKAEKFPIWYYDQTLELPWLLSQILAKTGLQQEIYVRPCLVNISNPAYLWRILNVPMLAFAKDKKQDYLYDILEKVLTAQGLILFSYRGKWFLDGLTRRIEQVAEYEVYYPDGTYKGNESVSVAVRSLQYNLTPQITAQTPFRRVNLNFESASDANLLPADVVKTDAYGVGALPNQQTTGGSYYTYFHDFWEKIGTTPYYRIIAGYLHYVYWASNGNEIPGGSSNYVMNESQAVSNPIECKAKPYVAPGRKYELEFDFKFGFFDFQDSLENLNAGLQAGLGDAILCFQLLLNGGEYISNRPSFPDKDNWQFDKEIVEQRGIVQFIRFTLKREFTVPAAGKLSLRFLPLIGPINDYGEAIAWTCNPQTIKINLLEKLPTVESGLALRDINFTQAKDVGVSFTSTVDSTVENSFGIAQRGFARFVTLPVPSLSQFQRQQYFQPSTVINITMEAWQVSQFFKDYIFNRGKNKSLFMRLPDGREIPYYSVFVGSQGNLHRMAVYLDYTADPQGQPDFPEDYTPSLNPDSGQLVLMTSLYLNEDNAKRSQWKIYGFPDASANTYLKTLAYAYHAVRPQTGFRLEATALDLIFPLQLVAFRYNNQVKRFIPTRLELDLSAGKTSVTMSEAMLSQLDDISYE